jgi:CheY-like chemotaxis protein
MTEPDADDDNWLIDEDEEAGATALQRRWRVLIVDDDADVHAVTRLALRHVSFKGRELELLSAYSGAQAYEILRDTPDIALVLLDVVMETDDAGLILARRIREELGNQIVRVVLRTGQPGQAPEQRVIVEYDINDYKAKTELTTQKLFTTVISALRACESLMMIERGRIGLGMILAAAADLYQARSLRQFASGVLGQVSAVQGIGDDGLLCVMAAGGARPPAMIAATGAYAALAQHELLAPDHPLLPAIVRALRDKSAQHEPAATILYVRSGQRELCIALTPPSPLGAAQRDLLELFGQRIGDAFNNLDLHGQPAFSARPADLI